MNFFSKSSKGSFLNISEARTISFSIAAMIYKNDNPDFFLMNAERFLEDIFKKKHPNNSIKPEQSKQLVKLAITSFVEDKNLLDLFVNKKIPLSEIPSDIKSKSVAFNDEYLSSFLD